MTRRSGKDWDEAYALGVEHAERAAVAAVVDYHQRGRISKQASDGMIDAISVGITRAGLRLKGDARNAQA
jgi:hypothetical protein